MFLVGLAINHAATTTAIRPGEIRHDTTGQAIHFHGRPLETMGISPIPVILGCIYPSIPVASPSSTGGTIGNLGFNHPFSASTLRKAVVNQLLLTISLALSLRRKIRFTRTF
jgi:hypothetical protein